MTLTATVSSGFGIASGMVTFEDFGTSIGSAALNSSGVATLSTTSLSQGPHSLVASYSGDSAHFASASQALAQIVKTAQQTATSIQVAPSANPVIATLTAPHQVTLTATVTPGAGSATGIVTLYDGARVLGTAMLDNNAQAELPTTALNVGGNSVTAVYAGDANFSACISAAVGVARSPRPH